MTELVSCSLFVKVGVSSLSRSRCAEPGCAKGCTEDIGMGVGDEDQISRVVLPDGLSNVNSS